MTEATGKSLPPRPRGEEEPLQWGRRKILIVIVSWKTLIIILSWCRWDRLILYQCHVNIEQRFNININSQWVHRVHSKWPWIRLFLTQIKALQGFRKSPPPAGTFGFDQLFWDNLISFHHRMVFDYFGKWRQMCCYWFSCVWKWLFLCFNSTLGKHQSVYYLA